MTKKCILFDADGVVMHGEMYSLQYQRESGVSNEEMLPFYIGIFQDCLVGKADLKEVILPWLEKWKFEGTADQFLKNWFEYEDRLDQQMIDFIQELRSKGIVCCLATNQEKHRGQYIRKEMGCAENFDHIYVSGEIGVKKPDPKYYEHIYQKMKERYGFTKEDLFYLDDTPKCVEGGRKAGIESYHFTDFAKFKEYWKLKFN